MAVPSLCDLCVDALSRHLHLFDCLEHLPEFASRAIVARYEQFFAGRLGKLRDDSLPGYLELLKATTATAAAPCAALKALNLPWCRRLTGAGVAAIAGDAALCANLRTLNLAFCGEQVGDAGVVPVCRACPLLVSVDLTFTGIGDGTLAALARACPRLERLSVEQCVSITDAGIQTLARGFKRGRLSHLNLGGLDKVSNVGFGILANHLQSLRMLSLSGCACLIDFDVEDLCKSLVLLEDLRLRCCWRITDAAVRHIARMAKRQTAAGDKRRQTVLGGGSSSAAAAAAAAARGGFGLALKKLDLGGCKRVSARAVACIGKSAARLEHLDLRGVELVDDGALECLARVCVNLRSVNLQGCPAVTAEGVACLRERGVPVMVVGPGGLRASRKK